MAFVRRIQNLEGLNLVTFTISQTQKKQPKINFSCRYKIILNESFLLTNHRHCRHSCLWGFDDAAFGIAYKIHNFVALGRRGAIPTPCVPWLRYCWSRADKYSDILPEFRWFARCWNRDGADLPSWYLRRRGAHGRRYVFTNQRTTGHYGKVFQKQ